MKLLLLALLGCATAFNSDLYEGYQVLEVVPKYHDQLTNLRELMKDTELDFWQEPVALNRPVHVMVARGQRPGLVRRLTSFGLTIKVHVQDVAENLKKSWNEILQNQDGTKAFDYNNFNTYTDYMNELDDLAAACPAGFTCTVSTIGQSYEDRALRVLKISSGSGKPTFWMDSLIHCREWLAGATLMKITNEMVRNYGSNAQAAALMDNYNWYILPVMNPDGYEFTWNQDRYWRKNRSPNSGSPCVGTDLNRNYDYGWGLPGASSLPCSDTYRGSSAASEVETQTVQNYAQSLTDNMWGWLTFHTYGYYMLYPFGDCSVPADFADLDRNVAAMCGAIEGTFNTVWDCGNSCQVLYDTSGTTTDWTRGVLGIKYVYTPELRGNDFVVAASQIDLSFQEVWNGLVAYVNDAAANPPSKL